MPTVRCPICRREFAPVDSPAMPFCSDRCRTIDLGRWIDHRYGLPVERCDEDEGHAPAASEAGED